MPALEINIFNTLTEKDIFINYPTFVETGTYLGETILALEPYFCELHTIEIKYDLFTNIQKSIMVIK